MSKTQAKAKPSSDDEDVEPVEELDDVRLDVPTEDADPEPDEETDGDRVQLVRTGWVRFQIAGHGRVRFRPARFGELRRLTEAADDMLDEITEITAAAQEAAGRRQDTSEALDADPVLLVEEIARRRAALRREDRKASREMVAQLDALRVRWWRQAHEILGVPGETWPEDDDLPAWFLQPALTTAVLQHFRNVPLDPGRK